MRVPARSTASLNKACRPTRLAAHFAPKPAIGAVLITGPISVSIREWLVPTLGSRPHDPLAAAGDSIWWTGQYVSKLGRVDPRTGAMKEFALPNARSRTASSKIAAA